MATKKRRLRRRLIRPLRREAPKPTTDSVSGSASEPIAAPVTKPVAEPVTRPLVDRVTKLPDPDLFTKLPDREPIPKLPDTEPITKLPDSEPIPKLPDTEPSPKLPDTQPIPKLPDTQPSPKLPDRDPIRPGVGELDPTAPRPDRPGPGSGLIELPDYLGDKGGANAQAFAGLADVPVLFLPARIETRFASVQKQPAALLKVRIYPDQIHVDDHARALSETEIAIGKRYWAKWKAANRAKDVDAARLEAREWLAGRLDARRAAWVARRTKPGVESAISKGGRAPIAGCLPDRWAVLGFVRKPSGELEQRFIAWTKPIRDDLKLGVHPDTYGTASAPGALPVDDGMRWMVDYDEAVEAGMAVTIDLASHEDVRAKGLAVLLVVGVSTREPSQSAADLRALLSAHNYTHGLAFAPQGTPTNNTDEVESPWSFRELDPLTLLARELDGAERADTRTSNGKRLARALGMPNNPLLARLEHAILDEDSPQRHMNRALWPVTWGQYFEHLLAGKSSNSAVPRAAIRNFERRFINQVRGGAPLPCLRVGAQPYGVLPVRWSSVPTQWADASPWFEHVLHFLRDAWLEAARTRVPVMDPVLGASGGTADNDPDSILTEILSSLPHPKRFLLRALHSWRETDRVEVDELGDVIVALLLPFLFFDDPTFGYEAMSVLGRWGWALEVLGSSDYIGMRSADLRPLDDPGLRDADAQIAALRDLRGRVNSLLSNTDDRKSARTWIDSMINLVEQHRERQAPLGEIAGATLDYVGIIAKEVDDPTLFYSVYEDDEDTSSFARELVASDIAAPKRYLAELANRVPTASSGVLAGRTKRAASRLTGVIRKLARPLPPGFDDSAPLLYQLLDSVVETIPTTDADRYREAISALRELPEDELELRLRETLGLASHRLDAYFTSLARERLGEVRERRANGLHLGGYGWVLDLVPDGKRALDSQGFIHAPSLQQATTAAVLRSGWSAHGSEDDRSMMAIDLRGDRVRLAAWLLDGVRQGQALGELLGYRFERSLHDAELDVWIDPVRRAVLLAAGVQRDPRAPVDGLALLELWDGAGGDPIALLAAVPPAHVPPAPATASVLTAHLELLTEALDAAGDAAIAESVHQVAQGNMTRAAATLDAINQGEVAPPELLGQRTPTGGPGVIHRIVVLLGDVSATSGWAKTARALAAPELEAWVGSIVGEAGEIGCRVRTVELDGARSDWEPLSMATLELAALDAIFEAPAGAPGLESRWGRRIAAHLQQAALGSGRSFDVEIDFESGGASMSMAEFAELARAVRALLTRARPLDARDLTAPDSDAEASLLASAAKATVDERETEFRARAQALTDLLPVDDASEAQPHPTGTASATALRDAMLGLRDYPLLGCFPQAGWTSGDDQLTALWAEAWSLGDKVLERVAALDAAQAAASEDATDVELLRRAATRLAVMFGRAFPLLPAFTPSDGAEIIAAFDRSGDLTGEDPAAIASFVSAAGRVRPQTAALDDLASVSELVRERTVVELKVAQLPALASDPWVATAPIPEQTGGRAHWVAVDHGGLAQVGAGGGRGLVIDEWTERIPATRQTTGVAFHFDAPAARAPQSLLLGVTPDAETKWSLELVVSTLLQTLDNAKIRAVGPQSLAAYGHHLPAIYSPKRLRGDSA